MEVGDSSLSSSNWRGLTKQCENPGSSRESRPPCIFVHHSSVCLVFACWLVYLKEGIYCKGWPWMTRWLRMTKTNSWPSSALTAHVLGLHRHLSSWSFMTLYFSQWPGTQRMATHHQSQPIIYPIWVWSFPVRLVIVLGQVGLSWVLLLLCCPSWVRSESHCVSSCSWLCVCSQYAKMCLAPLSSVLYLGPSTCSLHPVIWMLVSPMLAPN